jgi:hypothetical protein
VPGSNLIQLNSIQAPAKSSLKSEFASELELASYPAYLDGHFLRRMAYVSAKHATKM